MEIGFNSGFICGALDSFRKEVRLDAQMHEMLDSSSQCSMLLFSLAIFFHFFSFHWGCKAGVIFSTAIMSIGSILIMLGSGFKGQGSIYLGRTLICEIAGGFSSHSALNPPWYQAASSSIFLS
jgi:hypothetical protein